MVSHVGGVSNLPDGPRVRSRVELPRFKEARAEEVAYNDERDRAQGVADRVGIL